VVARGKHASVLLVGPFAVKWFVRGMAGNARKEYAVLKAIRHLGIAPRPCFRLGRLLVRFQVRGRQVRDMSDGELRRHAPAFLKALHELDKLNIMKEESHRPDKHFFWTRGGPRLIDFDRAHPGRGNVTQFLQFLNRVYPGITRLGAGYKKTLDLEPILKFIGSS